MARGRSMTSLTLPQKMRPRALKIARIPTGSTKRPNAPIHAGANVVSPRIAPIIGFHWPMAMSPEVAPKMKVSHSIAASGRSSISRAFKLAPVEPAFAFGVHPGGEYPSGGFRSNDAPSNTAAAHTMPCKTKKACQPMPKPPPAEMPSPTRST